MSRLLPLAVAFALFASCTIPLTPNRRGAWEDEPDVAPPPGGGPCWDTFMVDCGDDEPEPEPEPLFIEWVGFDCAEDRWTFEVGSSQPGGLTELDIVETGAPADVRWSEYGHQVGPDYVLTLDYVEEPELVEIATNGEGTTLFSCWWDDDASLAFKATLTNGDGSVADCAIWGNEADTEAFAGDGCICFDC